MILLVLLFIWRENIYLLYVIIDMYVYSIFKFKLNGGEIWCVKFGFLFVI